MQRREARAPNGPAPPLPAGRFAPARGRGRACLHSVRPRKGPTQPAPVSPVPGADHSDLRAPGAHRQSLSKSGPLGARGAPQPDLSRKSTARGGRGVAGSPFAGRRHVAGGCVGSGAGGRGQHDGGLGSGSELRRRGGDSRPGEPAHGRQPGLQGHQAQSAGPGHRQGCGGPEPVPGRHGFRLRKRDRPAHREREALFHDGTVWARQPKASVRCGHGPDRGLLHPLLPPVEGKDVSWGSWPQWVPRAARAFSRLVSGAPVDLQNTPLKWWLWSRNLPVWLGGPPASELEPCGQVPCVPGPTSEQSCWKSWTWPPVCSPSPALRSPTSQGSATPRPSG